MASAVNWNLKPVVALLAAATIGIIMLSMFQTDMGSTARHVMHAIGVGGKVYDFSNTDFLAEPLPETITINANAGDASGIKEKRIKIRGADIFYREAAAAAPETIIDMEKTFVLLHGQAFDSSTWQNTVPTIQTLSLLGNRVIAVDLPGFGSSTSSDEATADKPAFLEELLQKLTPDQKPILVSPSMSGSFSVPLFVRNSPAMCAYVPVAPVSTGDFTADDYSRVRIPALIVVGERDTSLGRTSVKNLEQVPAASKAQVIPKARHPAYLDDPERWHRLLVNFARKIEC